MIFLTPTQGWLVNCRREVSGLFYCITLWVKWIVCQIHLVLYAYCLGLGSVIFVSTLTFTQTLSLSDCTLVC